MARTSESRFAPWKNSVSASAESRSMALRRSGRSRWTIRTPPWASIRTPWLAVTHLLLFGPAPSPCSAADAQARGPSLEDVDGEELPELRGVPALPAVVQRGLGPPAAHQLDGLTEGLDHLTGDVTRLGAGQPGDHGCRQRRVERVEL